MTNVLQRLSGGVSQILIGHVRIAAFLLVSTNFRQILFQKKTSFQKKHFYGNKKGTYGSRQITFPGCNLYLQAAPTRLQRPKSPAVDGMIDDGAIPSQLYSPLAHCLNNKEHWRSRNHDRSIIRLCCIYEQVIIDTVCPYCEMMLTGISSYMRGCSVTLNQ